MFTHHHLLHHQHHHHLHHHHHHLLHHHHQGLAYSFRVVNSGLVQTLAQHRLSDTKGVLAMLQWVEAFMLNRRAG